MNKKTAVQLLLLSIVILISLVIFLKYFNQETTLKKEANLKKKTFKVLNNKSNIIKDIEYFSKDESGNTYSIKAKSGEINVEDSNILFLKNVKARISTLNSEDIFIESDFAKYNSKNLDTNFFENTKVKYEEHKIDCGYLDLLFRSNLAILYENIIYKNLKTKLLGDRLEIDLITKNSKLSMKDKKEKIKVFYIK